VRLGAPVFVDEAVLEEQAVTAVGLDARLEAETKQVAPDLPPGVCALSLRRGPALALPRALETGAEPDEVEPPR
jgi:hypothetical protein